jgi:hypothetical protein
MGVSGWITPRWTISINWAEVTGPTTAPIIW